ncbi:protein of unknown function [Streptomyces murinus]
MPGRPGRAVRVGRGVPDVPDDGGLTPQPLAPSRPPTGVSGRRPFAFPGGSHEPSPLSGLPKAFRKLHNPYRQKGGS